MQIGLLFHIFNQKRVAMGVGRKKQVILEKYTLTNFLLNSDISISDINTVIDGPVL